MTTQLAIPTAPSGDPLAIIAQSGKARRTVELYTTEITKYLDAGHALTDPAALKMHSETLSPGRARTFRSAIALWAKQTSKALDGQVTPDSWITVQATKARLGTLADSIQTETPKGEKAHTWSSRDKYAICATS